MFYKGICLENGLFMTGGSDFHGKNKPEVLLAHGINDNLNIRRHQLKLPDNM